MFTLGEIAQLGLPEGQFVVRVDDIEGGQSAADKPKIQFTGVVAQSDHLQVKVGMKQVWSYTWQPEYRSILGNDLMRAKLPPETKLTGNAEEDAKTLLAIMRGNFYVIQVKAQKNDPTRTNTNITAPFQGQGSAAVAPPTAPPAAVAAPPAPAPASGSLSGLFGGAPPPPPPAVTAAPAPASDEGLTPAIVAALQNHQRPPLNAKQIDELDQIGWTAIAQEYRAKQGVVSGTQPAPQNAAFADFAGI